MTERSSFQEVIEQTASEWIVRRANPEFSAAERAQLEAWLNQSAVHAEAFTRLQKAWSVFDRARQPRFGDEILVDLARRRRARRLRSRMAIGFAVLAVVAGLVTTRSLSKVAPEMSDRMSLVAWSVRKLPDGSIVELNRDAQIQVQFDGVGRVVTLDRGEAYFRVEKDPSRPFKVRAGGVDVVAVGTVFSVQVQKSAVEVVVTEGRVAVQNKGAAPADSVVNSAPLPATTFVDAGNKASVVTGDGKHESVTTVSAMTPEALNRRLAWRAVLTEFEEMRLADAVSLINQANRVQIVLADPSIGLLSVGGSFRSDNPGGFVAIVAASFDLRVDRRGDEEIVLTRK